MAGRAEVTTAQAARAREALERGGEVTEAEEAETRGHPGKGGGGGRRRGRGREG